MTVENVMNYILGWIIIIGGIIIIAKVKKRQREQEERETKELLDYQAKQIAIEMSKLKENNNDPEETHYIQENEE